VKRDRIAPAAPGRKRCGVLPRLTRHLAAIKVAAVIGLLASGCDPQVPPTAAPSPPATPTADIRLGAADAYLAALSTYKAGIQPVQAGICASAGTAATLRSCWSEKLAIQRTFDAAVSRIAFPTDLLTDVHTMFYVNGRLEQSMAAISASRDPARDLADLGVFSSASVDFLQISSNLREELGIIIPPSP
jgi:hypothetical protein